MLEIRRKTNSESKQDTNTISDTPSIDKQEQSNWNKPETSKNRTTPHSNNTKQILTKKWI